MNEQIQPLVSEDVVPGDVATTIWRWCLRNGWTFVPDFQCGEPLIDIRCANEIVTPGNAMSTGKKSLLHGIKRHPGGTVKLSEVVSLEREKAG